jgi:ATP-dependent DNA helicase UvrD/PcrA
MALTGDQAKAIADLTGNLQLIACAGSGKTEVVARRIAKFLTPAQRGGGSLSPSNIIAFTFTEKAAAELKQRVLERCSESIPQAVGLAEMYIGTIHGFCLELLKTEVPEFLKYDVLDEVQQTLLVDRNSSKSGLTRCSTLTGQPLKRFIDTPLYVQALSVLRESKLHEGKLQSNSVYKALPDYRALLGEKGYLDYSSIMDEAVHAIATHTPLRNRLKDRIKIVIVDEYQDINPIQENLIEVLRDLGASITVVGDDDQTIYQWRGGDVKNIMYFAERYNAKTIKIEENFRSTPGITDVARLIIEKNANRLTKVMKSAEMQAYESGDIVAVQLSDPEAEADYIADVCKALRGTPIKDGARSERSPGRIWQSSYGQT